MSEPTTEAGRALLAGHEPGGESWQTRRPDLQRAILAIEDEMRVRVLERIIHRLDHDDVTDEAPFPWIRRIFQEELEAER